MNTELSDSHFRIELAGALEAARGVVSPDSESLDTLAS